MAVWRDAPDAAERACPGCGAQRAQPDVACAQCGVPPPPRRQDPHVRDRDLEPYTALLYIGRLFKVLSVLIVLALAGELVLGILVEGSASLGTFLGEAMRLLALAGLLWAGGDIVRLMIHAGHDMRMSRILLGRIGTRFKQSPAASAPRQRDGRRAS